MTELLQAWSRGDVVARDQLFPLVYAELRRRAARYLRRERPGHTLQPTALVHEAYVRLSGQNQGWKNRAQFFAVASQIMHRILVDHARARRAAKRPWRRMQVTLAEEAAASGPREVDLLAWLPTSLPTVHCQTRPTRLNSSKRLLAHALPEL